MASRMERYQETESNPRAQRRTEKHKDLYQNFYTKTVYKEISPIDESTPDERAVDLSAMKLQKATRESYHKVKEIEDFMAPVSNKKTSDLSVFFHEEQAQPKVYDINSVLEQAKKNREEKDELEKRRKLRNTDYNILASLKPEELEEKAKQIEKSKKHSQEEELEELIHTITSGSLRKEIDKASEKDDNSELLSDLMPSNLNETVISEDLSKEILDKEAEKEKSTEEKKDGIDHSFYTRSMDLSDTDFDEEATDEEFIEKSHPVATFIKVLIAVILVIGLAVLVFYFMNRL